MIKKAFLKLKQFIPTDMLWIFGTSVSSQLFGFLSSVFVVRLMDKTTYGLYLAAYN